MNESASLRSWRFATRLDRRGSEHPVGPSQRCRDSQWVQGVAWRLVHRLCLLKGCERTFRPRHPFSRYCSSACRAAARRWRRRLANRRYRASEQGKCRRRAQTCRYRQRVRERERTASCARPDGEGYPHLKDDTDSCCRRPGCYEGFAKTTRSPLQKFCSAACRLALRRVLIRERRWRRRLRGDQQVGRRNHDSW